MKVRNTVVVMMGLVCLLMFAFSPAVAATAWTKCSVEEVITLKSGGVQFKLKKAGFAALKVFNCPTGQESKMMAVAIAAMNANTYVSAKIDWAVPNTDVDGLKLLKELVQ